MSVKDVVSMLEHVGHRVTSSSFGCEGGRYPTAGAANGGDERRWQTRQHDLPADGALPPSRGHRGLRRPLRVGARAARLAHPRVAALLGLAPGSGSRRAAPAEYLVASLQFDDQAAFAQAMGSPEGSAAAQDIGNFATGGVTMLTGEVTTYL